MYNFITKMKLSKLQIKQYIHQIFERRDETANTSYAVDAYEISDVNLDAVDITEVNLVDLIFNDIFNNPIMNRATELKMMLEASDRQNILLISSKWR